MLPSFAFITLFRKGIRKYWLSTNSNNLILTELTPTTSIGPIPVKNPITSVSISVLSDLKWASSKGKKANWCEIILQLFFSIRLKKKGRG
jgi:hypothetical protein